MHGPFLGHKRGCSWSCTLAAVSFRSCRVQQESLLNGKLEVLEAMRQPGSADWLIGISQTLGSPKTQDLVWVSFLNKTASHSISDLSIPWASKETVAGEHFIANARSLFQLRGTSQGSFWIFHLRPLERETKFQGRCSELGRDTTPNSGALWNLNTFAMIVYIIWEVCMASVNFYQVSVA